jgi:hypothetical protein
MAERADSGQNPPESLPSDFFERLTERQEAMIKILLDHDGWVLGPDIREEMQNEYDVQIAERGSGTAGIISGFTRKYGKEFRNKLIDGRWTHPDSGNRIAEHTIGEQYENELRDYFNM